MKNNKYEEMLRKHMEREAKLNRYESLLEKISIDYGIEKPEIEMSDEYSYDEEMNVLWIGDIKNYTEEGIQDIIDFIDNKYGVRLTKDNIDIFSFLHEVGHAIAVGKERKRGTFDIYMNNNKKEMEVLNKLMNNMNGIFIEEELKKINKLYREITAEIDADKYGLELMKKYI
jgi:hypothetical protein